MRIRSNHWINRQRDMVNGVQSCELDLTVPTDLTLTIILNFLSQDLFCFQSMQNPLISQGIFGLVEHSGFEPLTSTMRM